MSENYDQERVMGWDDVFEKDQDEFVIAPAGDYIFEVVNFERKRHTPSPTGKIPACPKAEMTLRISSGEDVIDFKHNLFLHSRCEGLNSAFFRAIGQKKHGEPLKPDWENIIGSFGRCKVEVRTWTGKDGNEMKSNQVKRFYDFDPDATAKDESFEPDGF